MSHLATVAEQQKASLSVQAAAAHLQAVQKGASSTDPFVAAMSASGAQPAPQGSLAPTLLLEISWQLNRWVTDASCPVDATWTTEL